MKVTSRTPTVSLVNFKRNSSSSLGHLKSTNHLANQRGHFQKRFRERVGWILSDAAYDELADLVKQRGKWLYRKDERGSTYAVVFRGINIKVVYDAFKHSLITILPL